MSVDAGGIKLYHRTESVGTIFQYRTDMFVGVFVFLGLEVINQALLY